MLQKLAGEKVQVHCNWQRRPELIAILSFSSKVTVLYVATTVLQLKHWKLKSSFVWSEYEQRPKQYRWEKWLWSNVNMSHIFIWKVIMLLCKGKPHRYSRYLKEHNNSQYWLLTQKISLTVTEQFYLFYAFLFWGGFTVTWNIHNHIYCM